MGKLGVKIPKNAFKKGQAKYKESDDFNDVELDPGRYVCVVTGGRAVDTPKGPSVVVDLKVAGDHEEAGGRVSVWFSLDEDRIVWLFRALTTLGYEVDDLDESMLAEILDDLSSSKPVVQLEAKRSGEYINYRIKKALEELSASDVEAAAEGEEDEPTEKPSKPSDDEDEDEDEEEDEDPLASLDRAALKKLLKEKGVSLRVTKSTTDDAIRDAIRAADSASDEEEEEDDPEGDDDEVEIAPGMKVTATYKGSGYEAEVVSIDEDAGKVLVKFKADDKIKKVKLGPENLSL